jgi:hypothetical protein
MSGAARVRALSRDDLPVYVCGVGVHAGNVVSVEPAEQCCCALSAAQTKLALDYTCTGSSAAMRHACRSGLTWLINLGSIHALCPPHLHWGTPQSPHLLPPAAAG